MARPLRIAYPGALYHVTGRGNRREPIFLHDDDRRMFLELLAAVVGRLGWRCHAYCLMDNHYHFVVATPGADLSRGMRQLNGVYTQRFNRRHDRVGHVFQGRNEAILVERESYLLELCRYVALNPVRAGMVAEAGDWPWSSYRATAGRTRAPVFLHLDELFALLGGGGRRAHARYRRFVAKGIGAPGPWEALAGAMVLGGEAFRAEVVAARTQDPEVPSRQRHMARPPLDALGECDQPRADWMGRAYRDHGYTMREIAAHAGLHYGTVSKIIKAWEATR